MQSNTKVIYVLLYSYIMQTYSPLLFLTETAKISNTIVPQPSQKVLELFTYLYSKQEYNLRVFVFNFEAPLKNISWSLYCVKPILRLCG